MPETELRPEIATPAETTPSRRGRVPGWLIPAVGFVAVAVGLYAGPTMPWADDRPTASSVEAGFARDMTLHHDQAVQMSLIALERSTSPDVRQLAKDVVLTQTAQIGSMQGWLELWQLPLRDRSQRRMAWMGDGHPLEADGRMPGMATADDVSALESLSGTALDVRYLTLLHEHHVGGIPMAEIALGRTDITAVQQLAGSVRDSQSAELRTLEAMLQRRGAPAPPSAGSHAGGHHG